MSNQEIKSKLETHIIQRLDGEPDDKDLKLALDYLKVFKPAEGEQGYRGPVKGMLDSFANAQMVAN